MRMHAQKKSAIRRADNEKATALLKQTGEAKRTARGRAFGERRHCCSKRKAICDKRTKETLKETKEKEKITRSREA